MHKGKIFSAQTSSAASRQWYGLTLQRVLRRLIDKKNARRYDDCIIYSLISAKKVDNFIHLMLFTYEMWLPHISWWQRQRAIVLLW